MGEVYQARDTKLDRDVALKVLPRARRRSTPRPHLGAPRPQTRVGFTTTVMPQDRSDSLISLARYAARLLTLDDLSPAQFPVSEARLVRERRRATTAPVRRAVLDKNFRQAFLHLRECDTAARFRFLERAVQQIPRDQRLGCFDDVWVTTKWRPRSTAGVIRLFRAAPELRHTVPAELPTEVRVYRGVCVRGAQRRYAIRRPSWTLHEEMAKKFARIDEGIKRLALRDPERLGGDRGEYLASATVARAKILAYFDDWREEAECVVDPRDLRNVRVTRLDATG